jgi:hypothetical protein
VINTYLYLPEAIIVWVLAHFAPRFHPFTIISNCALARTSHCLRRVFCLHQHASRLGKEIEHIVLYVSFANQNSSGTSMSSTNPTNAQIDHQLPPMYPRHHSLVTTTVDPVHFQTRRIMFSRSRHHLITQCLLLNSYSSFNSNTNSLPRSSISNLQLSTPHQHHSLSSINHSPHFPLFLSAQPLNSVLADLQTDGVVSYVLFFLAPSAVPAIPSTPPILVPQTAEITHRQPRPGSLRGQGRWWEGGRQCRGQSFEGGEANVLNVWVH